MQIQPIRDPVGSHQRPGPCSRRNAFVTNTLAVLMLLGALAAHRPAASASEPVPVKLAPSLARLAANRPEEPVVVWVTFADRAGAERNPAAHATQGPLVSARSLERRVRRGAIAGIVESDLPVHEPYVRALVARGAKLRGTSRWLNAASVELPARLAAELSHLPFVVRAEIVPRAARITPVNDPSNVFDRSSTEHGLRQSATTVVPPPGDPAYYGVAYHQLAMMQVPQLHAAGLSGAGVLVCMLDSGFRTTHAAYAGLDVLARRDFINGDTNVDVDPAQDMPGQASHGTLTLGCVAGSLPGTYSGVAYNATVALGKTEYVPTEDQVEMDFWQFGAEWADSLGADVISSSLGYSRFDSGTNYTFDDMDGRTTVVARAAIEAARRGISVVNSAGNEGASSWGKIISPADADTILSVGAVDSANVVTGFSSRGPTADGRIKPDVTARGRGVWVPAFDNNTSYVTVSGTSFSCPLTAGVVALLLESHPNWGPFEVREALRETALNHASPDTVIGWGLVQALAASQWIPSTIGVPTTASTRLSLQAGPNPLREGAELSIRYAVPAASIATIDVLDLAGRRRATLHPGGAASSGIARWNGRDSRNTPLPAGVYWLRLSAASGRREESRAVRIVLLP